MLRNLQICLSLTLFFLFVKCKQETKITNEISSENTVKYAKGFSIENYEGYTIITVKNPWPKASKTYQYLLIEKDGIVPDSLNSLLKINVPIKNIVVTSTTHIPSLEMLKEENSLVGFPNLDYISSDKVRTLIDAKKIKELGGNQSLNTEVLIDLQPEVIIGYGLDNNNPTLDNLQKSGLKVMLNGDWNEETPLGKAEWIKFFGALYGKQKEANEIFDKIEKDFLKTIEIAKMATSKPTILAGDMFEDKWYLPKGTSWGSQLLVHAQGDYLWKETNGTGSLSLSFETVLEKAKEADFWITSGQFSSLKQMTDANPHYEQFMAFQNKNVYSFTRKKGKTGGVLYYELAPNRPDLVLKDLVKILHPELLVGYEPFFFEKLK
ncbi:ABC transporter substrate-binding protein [Flavobacterium aquatile]|uniref:ABC transporter substrate-binding protein n=1 Tax=Flavobacterium aquatile LMG 4008 = ATCC 11947 TaxID=1453498 RepID=A0A095U4W7_9FLAO|nr:ABC transporter substrate-binding protein [Flavobacterium aquatile]KGD69683.1 ABC transporter substrate-binding protein [Flavobacterium aquatile LMG 4008 = ATCC 11947]OXA67179.1 ABC transporter substrate-binding protein [Flavobacterium aquatile LMG 4008 = ATCC 11947]GEC77835.1 ABC transporter substrate-binding protein [Flavobacterium aquatile]